MPNIKSSTKRMELSQAANLRNRAKRSRLRTTIKRVRTATDAAEAEKFLREAVSLLDRAARTRLLHPNTVARAKSRLAAHVRRISDAA